jgi:PAS domain S-box-containing protein
MRDLAQRLGAWPYAYALATVAAAVVVGRAFRLGSEPGVFAPFLLAIVATALRAGTLAGFAAIGASVVAAYVFFLAPFATLAFDPVGLWHLTLFRLGVLTAAGLGIVLLVERSHRELEALQRSRRQLKSFIADDAVGLQVIDHTGRVTWADPAAITLLGYEQDEHIGSHLTKFHVDGPLVDGALARIAAGQPIENMPVRLRRKDGSAVEVLLNSNALLSDPGAHGAGVLLALMPVPEAPPQLDGDALIASVLERRRRSVGVPR